MIQLTNRLFWYPIRWRPETRPTFWRRLKRHIVPWKITSRFWVLGPFWWRVTP